MALTFGFYNSVGGDRTYNAVQMSSIFDGIITDGVFKDIGNKLLVTSAGSGMLINVDTGKAWFNHTWTLNDASIQLTVPNSDIVLNRIDAVVLEVDASDAVRTNSIKVITGTPATVPVEPTMANTATLHQHPLAYISVGAGVSVINPGNITSLVGSVLCPYVTVPQAAGGGAGGAAVLEVQVFS